MNYAEVIIQILRKLIKVMADHISDSVLWYAWQKRRQARSIVRELDELEDELVDLLKSFSSGKMSRIYRYLQDLKGTVAQAMDMAGLRSIYLVLDDFYQLNIDEQAEVLDFLQNLCKNTSIFLKFGTIPHRSCLYRKGKLTVGMQVAHDVQPIDLDRSFQNFFAVEEFLRNLWINICKSVSRKVDFTPIFEKNSWHQLILASGGVPRDFLNILSRAIDIARSTQKEKLDVPTINEAANLYLHETKREDLRFDALEVSDKLEIFLGEIIDFCLKEHKTNLFLVSKDEMRKFSHIAELFKQLMDFRFIHRVHENVSAQRQGSRYEAYMLDVGLYGHLQQSKESRIEEIPFWERDEAKRVKILGTAPIYTLKDELSLKKAQKEKDQSKSAKDLVRKNEKIITLAKLQEKKRLEQLARMKNWKSLKDKHRSS